MTRTLKRAVLACTLVLAACSSPPATTSQSTFSYLGEVQFPSGFLFDDTTVGGLSAISRKFKQALLRTNLRPYLQSQ